MQIDADDLENETMKAATLYGDLDNDGLEDADEIQLDWTLNEFNAWFQACGRTHALVHVPVSSLPL